MKRIADHTFVTIKDYTLSMSMQEAFEVLYDSYFDALAKYVHFKVDRVEDGEDSVLQEDLETDIEISVETNIVDTKVYLLKSSREEKFLADEKEIPLGLYIINGMVEQEDGTTLSVKDFMANTDNIAKIENRINNSSESQFTNPIERYLAELIELGIDVGAYEERFAAGINLDVLVDDLELALESAGGSIDAQYDSRNSENLSIVVREYMTQLSEAGIDVSTYQTRMDAGEDLVIIKDELEALAQSNSITLQSDAISEAMKEKAQAKSDEAKAQAEENQAEASENASENKGKGKN